MRCDFGQHKWAFAVILKYFIKNNEANEIISVYRCIKYKNFN